GQTTGRRYGRLVFHREAYLGTGLARAAPEGIAAEQQTERCQFLPIGRAREMPVALRQAASQGAGCERRARSTVASEAKEGTGQTAVRRRNREYPACLAREAVGARPCKRLVRRSACREILLRRE